MPYSSNTSFPSVADLSAFPLAAAPLAWTELPKVDWEHGEFPSVGFSSSTIPSRFPPLDNSLSMDCGPLNMDFLSTAAPPTLTPTNECSTPTPARGSCAGEALVPCLPTGRASPSPDPASAAGSLDIPPPSPHVGEGASATPFPSDAPIPMRVTMDVPPPRSSSMTVSPAVRDVLGAIDGVLLACKRQTKSGSVLRQDPPLAQQTMSAQSADALNSVVSDALERANLLCMVEGDEHAELRADLGLKDNSKPTGASARGKKRKRTVVLKDDVSEEEIERLLAMRPSDCTPEERAIRKRAKNRRAAQHSRMRKRDAANALRAKIKTLVHRNVTLEEGQASLRSENEVLKRKLACLERLLGRDNDFGEHPCAEAGRRCKRARPLCG